MLGSIQRQFYTKVVQLGDSARTALLKDPGALGVSTSTAEDLHLDRSPFVPHFLAKHFRSRVDMRHPRLPATATVLNCYQQNC